MPSDRWMDKEDVVHIYNGILLSHKKERNLVICWDVDGSRDCHTEWSKSEREKQISYINSYMWILEKWYRWTGLQVRNRETDVENKRMDTKGGKPGGRGCGGGVMNWAIGIDMYTLMCIKLMTSKNLLYIKKKENHPGIKGSSFSCHFILFLPKQCFSVSQSYFSKSHFFWHQLQWLQTLATWS